MLNIAITPFPVRDKKCLLFNIVRGFKMVEITLFYKSDVARIRIGNFTFRLLITFLFGRKPYYAYPEN